MALETFSLTGRRALVTGSTQGIGFGLARGLAGAGATVVLNGRGAERVAAAAEKLRAEGFQVEEAAFDVTDGAAATAAVDRIEAESGPIDILLNNAGINRRAALHEMDEAAWRAVIDTNLNSVFLVSKAVARHMIPRGRGKIVNTCSVMSELGRPTVGAYAAAKGALRMLTRSMCADWGLHGIQANGIGPGYFKTELTSALASDKAFTDWLVKRTPAGRWGEIDDLVGAAVYLSSPASDFVNGHLLAVDGGLTVVV